MKLLNHRKAGNTPLRRTLAILQARMSSRRLPGKVLMQLQGRPMLLHQLDRIRASKRIDQLVVATSTDPSDDPIEKICTEHGFAVFRGPLNDVLERFYLAACANPSDDIVRLTGDCPVIDPAVIDDLIDFYRQGKFDYASNTLKPTFPDGLDAEVFSFTAITEARNAATLPMEREHVSPYIYRHPDQYRLGSFENQTDYSSLRWTVDEMADFQFIEAIYRELYPTNPRFGFNEILAFLQKHPDLMQLNQHYRRNEGLEMPSHTKPLEAISK